MVDALGVDWGYPGSTRFEYSLRGSMVVGACGTQVGSAGHGTLAGHVGVRIVHLSFGRHVMSCRTQQGALSNLSPSETHTIEMQYKTVWVSSIVTDACFSVFDAFNFSSPESWLWVVTCSVQKQLCLFEEAWGESRGSLGSASLAPARPNGAPHAQTISSLLSKFHSLLPKKGGGALRPDPAGAWAAHNARVSWLLTHPAGAGPGGSRVQRSTHTHTHTRFQLLTHPAGAGSGGSRVQRSTHPAGAGSGGSRHAATRPRLAAGRVHEVPTPGTRAETAPLRTRCSGNLYT